MSAPAWGERGLRSSSRRLDERGPSREGVGRGRSSPSSRGRPRRVPVVFVRRSRCRRRARRGGDQRPRRAPHYRLCSGSALRGPPRVACTARSRRRLRGARHLAVVAEPGGAMRRFPRRDRPRSSTPRRGRPPATRPLGGGHAAPRASSPPCDGSVAESGSTLWLAACAASLGRSTHARGAMLRGRFSRAPFAPTLTASRTRAALLAARPSGSSSRRARSSRPRRRSTQFALELPPAVRRDALARAHSPSR